MSSSYMEGSDVNVRSIPTEDAAAALDFCRFLAHFFKTPADQTCRVMHHRFPESFPIDLSVVIPVYNEQDNLPTLSQRLIAVLEDVGLSYELVFVDDGSVDGSCAYLRELCMQQPRVVFVELARNFGHQIAVSAGLAYARGQAVIVMDADLQDPPEVLPQFIAKWQEGYEVVYAIRHKRKESWFKRAAYAAFYRLLHQLSDIDIPLDSGDFCIMDRCVVDLLNAMPERNRFVRGIRSWVGFRQTGLAYERAARYAGRSKYPFRKLLALALDGLISFSYVPLRVITVAGFGVSTFSIALAIFYALKRIFAGLNPPGFATLTVALFFLSGVQLLTLGVIGEYIGRISDEVKQRPLFVVRKVTWSPLYAPPDAQQ